MARQIVGPATGEAASALLAQRPAKMLNDAMLLLGRHVRYFVRPDRHQAREIALALVA